MSSHPDIPFRHVIGTETEHPVHDPTDTLTHNNIINWLPTFARRFGLVANYEMRGNNGCRVYRDQGKLEFATPECSTGAAAALHELAGTMFLNRMALQADRRIKRPATLQILRCNTSQNGDSGGGNHVNISMPLQEMTFEDAFSDAVRHLTAFVTTLQLITGTGVVLPKDRAATRLGGPEYGFAISPRGFHVTKDWSGQAASGLPDGDKPIFIRRDEPNADPYLFWRLQIAGLDSNIIPSILELKLELLLLMAEMFTRRELKPLELHDGEGFDHSSRVISLDWRTPFQTTLRRSMTALQVQRYFYDQANDYVIKHRNGRGRDILDHWARLLKAFETKEDIPRALYGEVDWVTKAILLERMQARPNFDYYRAEYMHILYQEYRFQRQYGVFGTPGFIRRASQALMDAPPDTRAWGRGELTKLRPYGLKVDWHELRLNGTYIRLPDPAAPTTSHLDKVMQRLQKAA
jgi:hypothetical protein